MKGVKANCGVCVVVDIDQLYVVVYDCLCPAIVFGDKLLSETRRCLIQGKCVYTFKAVPYSKQEMPTFRNI